MAVRTPYTPLYEDVLDYLERSGLPSVGGIFDDYDQSTNPFITNFDELTNSDKTGINSLTNPLLPIVNDNSGDELALIRQKMLEEQGGYPRGIDYSDPNIQNYKNFIHPTMNQIANDDDDDVFDYEYDAYGIVDPLNIGARQSTMQQIGLKVAEDVRREQIEREKEKQRQLEEAKRIQDAIEAQNISRQEAEEQQKAIEKDQERDSNRGGVGEGEGGVDATGPGSGGGYNQGNFCFDPNTSIQMADGSEKKIKEIQLGDNTKGGEVTGVFQFKASDEIHNYKGVTVAGSHYVKEDGKFIMVKDSPLSVKIDKIPVVYSLDTTGRRIFINDIEFADYNGDGVAKNFLTNAGVDLTGFDKEVLRQVENRLI
jgi:hypothetical protein